MVLAALNRLIPKTLVKSSLRTVLIIPFVLQTVGATGLVGYLSFLNGQRAVNDLATQLRNELTARIQRELRGYVEAPHSINRLNASALAEGKINVLEATGENLLWQQMKIFSNLAFVYCSSSSRGEFFGVLRSPEDGTLQLSYGNQDNDFLRYYYSLDTRGNRNYLLYQADKPYDARSRPWYSAALAAGGPAWTDVYIAFTTQLPNITASLPVYDETGNRLIGVCATDVVLPEEFRRFLSSLDIGQWGQAFIVDRSGNLISSSIDEPLVAGTGDNADPIPAVTSRNLLTRSTARHLTAQYGEFNGLSAFQTSFKLKGDRQFVQVAPFSDGRGLDWVVVVVVPETDFMAQINANTRTTLLLCIGAFILAIASGILTTRWITQPILGLNASAKKLAKGEWEQTVELQRSDEVGELAKSFYTMANQLRAAFNTLEDRVKERTTQLAQANREITLLNKKLEADNLRMSAELDVTRRLQQMILPREAELASIEDLEISGFMEPATEVGGDYYDVLTQDDVVTIGIGDVTGHGLESGMVMLMTQTAVRTLQEMQEQDPINFLDVLNRTLYQNIQRMRSDKNLSLAILTYYQGRLSLSGQHEEIIIVRTGGKIERIDTLDLGFPIGLTAQISDFIDQVSIQLSSGDGVVLYTDGISEAEDVHGELYGLDRLCQVISQYWHLSSEQIRQAVVTDVRQHIGKQEIFDDITLLVLKLK